MTILFLFRQNLLCDVTLVADGIEIPAHKMVLASCSPYFYAMFTSFTESKAEKITIQGVDGQALQILVDYVYSSEIQVTEDNVQVTHKITFASQVVIGSESVVQYL